MSGRSFDMQYLDFVGVILSVTGGPDVTVRVDNLRAVADKGADPNLVEGFNTGSVLTTKYAFQQRHRHGS